MKKKNRKTAFPKGNPKNRPLMVRVLKGTSTVTKGKLYYASEVSMSDSWGNYGPRFQITNNNGNTVSLALHNCREVGKA